LNNNNWKAILCWRGWCS